MAVLGSQHAALWTGDVSLKLSSPAEDGKLAFEHTICVCADHDPSHSRNVACIASRGQAMCVSFHPASGTVLWGSESAAQDVDCIEDVCQTAGRREISLALQDLEAGGVGTQVSVLCTHKLVQ